MIVRNGIVFVLVAGLAGPAAAYQFTIVEPPRLKDLGPGQDLPQSVEATAGFTKWVEKPVHTYPVPGTREDRTEIYHVIQRIMSWRIVEGPGRLDSPKTEDLTVKYGYRTKEKDTFQKSLGSDSGLTFDAEVIKFDHKVKRDLNITIDVEKEWYSDKTVNIKRTYSAGVFVVWRRFDTLKHTRAGRVLHFVNGRPDPDNPSDDIEDSVTELTTAVSGTDYEDSIHDASPSVTLLPR